MLAFGCCFDTTSYIIIHPAPFFVHLTDPKRYFDDFDAFTSSLPQLIVLWKRSC